MHRSFGNTAYMMKNSRKKGDIITKIIFADTKMILVYKVKREDGNFKDWIIKDQYNPSLSRRK